jgi:hypothetical protein
MIIGTILKCRQFAVYGAQVVAYGAHVALRALYDRTPASGSPADLALYEVRNHRDKPRKNIAEREK